MSTDPNEPGFLARWSRLKRGEPVPPAPLAPGSAAGPVEPEKPEDQPAGTVAGRDEPDAPQIELPKIEDLTATSDFTVFLRKGVPLDLQRLALRQAWSLDPAIRDFIEVAENQYDWNAVDGVPGFGPLDPGTDLKRLLAQATGHLEPADAGDAASDAMVPQSDVALNETEIAAQNAARTDRLTRPDKVQPVGGTLDDDDQPAAEAQVPHVPAETIAGHELPPAMASSGPYRRRHGGALPS